MSEETKESLEVLESAAYEKAVRALAHAAQAVKTWKALDRQLQEASGNGDRENE